MIGVDAAKATGGVVAVGVRTAAVAGGGRDRGDAWRDRGGDNSSGEGGRGCRKGARHPLSGGWRTCDPGTPAAGSGDITRRAGLREFMRSCTGGERDRGGEAGAIKTGADSTLSSSTGLACPGVTIRSGTLAWGTTLGGVAALPAEPAIGNSAEALRGGVSQGFVAGTTVREPPHPAESGAGSGGGGEELGGGGIEDACVGGGGIEDACVPAAHAVVDPDGDVPMANRGGAVAGGGGGSFALASGF